jgi:hypothetical protein
LLTGRGGGSKSHRQKYSPPSHAFGLPGGEEPPAPSYAQGFWEGSWGMSSWGVRTPPQPSIWPSGGSRPLPAAHRFDIPSPSCNLSFRMISHTCCRGHTTNPLLRHVAHNTHSYAVMACPLLQPDAPYSIIYHKWRAIVARLPPPALRPSQYISIRGTSLGPLL